MAKPLISGDIGGYRVQIRGDTGDAAHDLDGAYCIPDRAKSNTDHLNVEIYDLPEYDWQDKDLLFDAHVGNYKEPGKICPFYWDSESNVCHDRCFDEDNFDMDALDVFIEEALREAENNGAEILAAISIGALVKLVVAAWAIPVVPPAPP
ncbi:hypothetical protein [Haloferax larsenii]|uniref:Uncharacterized protein n=1 Tax=Haloferax larsenii TaxID=302484 RepID=A0A1H7T0D4_HALLR|nr:hypothetical protein [Haloferax larsenii]SEL78372.1 hypothetical protein SAMN04488691_10822 [Haloferax larsenii]